MPETEIRSAHAGELRKVLRLTLATRGQAASELERQVTAFIGYARELSIDLGRHWICTRDGRPLTAGTLIKSPGRTATLLLPDSGTAPVDPPTLADLISRAVAGISKRDVRLLQCLVHPDDSVTLMALEKAGFRPLAMLRYLEWIASEQVLGHQQPPESLADRTIEWITYDHRHHDEFAELISATYEDSLDCPGLCGLRHIDDVMEGHKAAGRFDPQRWMLLRCDGEAAGCILFAENPLRATLELVYMGVHPKFRRMGLGTLLLNHGLAPAHDLAFVSVTVAVDDENTRARKMYERAGFRTTTRRRALIHTLSSTRAGA
ncbi:MAG: GNAT family N-acetyltransferase [Planctomycetota bacterium]